jgi:CDP-diacylglycerol--glycerol-3-phosphate 3-phosphatidyltransferase
MNLPNKLTLFRVILIPFFLVALMVPAIPGGKWVAVGIFAIASLTDLLDGKIARKYNLVTDFGKFMDPLADKLLVCSAMIALIDLNRIPAWVVIIIIAREFIISGFRLVAADNGIVIAASYWGKFKTTFQMLMVILLILNLRENLPNAVTVITICEQVLIYVSLILTVVSLIDYLVKNRKVITDGGM